MNLKNFLMVFYLIISAFYFAGFQASILIYTGFFLNFIVLTFIVYYHLYLEKVFSPFLSTFIVFNYLFFLVAPISQINAMLLAQKDPVFVNNFPYQEPLVFKTCLLILIFNVIFFLTYDYLKKRSLTEIKSPLGLKTKKNLSTAILFMVIISVAIVVSNADYIIYEYNRPEWMTSQYSTSISLIRGKVLFIFPLGVIIACKSYFVRKINNRNNIYIILFSLVLILFILAIVKNPLITKRHDLGPILFVALFVIFPRFINSNAKFLNITFFSMIIGFPLAQLFTHTDYGVEELVSKPYLILEQVNNGLFTDGYVSLNYDAFFNIGVVIEEVQASGFSYGYQLLSALLFFVPRSLWTGKPDSSGIVVGSRLDEHYEFYFQNVSNPYLSEAFHNFGILGVILFALALGIFCVNMLRWLHSNSWLKKGFALYSAVHLIFILRGDFTNSFSILVATFLGIYYLPKIIIDLFENYTFVK